MADELLKKLPAEKKKPERIMWQCINQSLLQTKVYKEVIGPFHR